MGYKSEPFIACCCLAPPSHLSPLQKTEISHCALAALLPNSPSITSACCVSANIPTCQTTGDCWPIPLQKETVPSLWTVCSERQSVSKTPKNVSRHVLLSWAWNHSLGAAWTRRNHWDTATTIWHWQGQGQQEPFLPLSLLRTNKKVKVLQLWRHLELPRDQVTHEVPKHSWVTGAHCPAFGHWYQSSVLSWAWPLRLEPNLGPTFLQWQPVPKELSRTLVLSDTPV